MPPQRLRLLFGVFGVTFLVVLLVSSSRYSFRPESRQPPPPPGPRPAPPVVYDVPLLDTPSPIPQKIWQTWKVAPFQLEPDERDVCQTWIDKNPHYQYELLTDASAQTYVRRHFPADSNIYRHYFGTADHILRADFLRYMILYASGGVYTDIDTTCGRPIDDWIPTELREKTNLAIGIEYDQRDDELFGGMHEPIQFCQWTIMSKPGHPVMENVLNRVMKQLDVLEARYDQPGAVRPNSSTDIMDTTGPRLFTSAVFEGLSQMMGSPVNYTAVTKLDAPKLIGDVLIFRINAFGSGQPHSGSLEAGNDEELSHHNFKGSWKDPYDD